MKNIIKLAGLAAVLAFGACNKETTDLDATTETEALVMSTEIQAASNELVGTENEGGNVVDKGGNIAEGPNGNGRPRGFGGFGRGTRGNHPHGISADSIGFNDLPDSVKIYLRANVVVDSIRRIVRITLRDSSVIYGIRLPNRTHLFLNPNGTVVVMPTRNIQFTAITLDSLPTAAQTFLTAQGVTTANAVSVLKATLSNGTIQYVVLTSSGNRYIFDAAGNRIRRR